MSRDNLCDAMIVQVDQQYAWVQTVAQPQACGACGQKAQCAVGVAGQGLDGQARGQTLRVENHINARPGDRVTLCLASGNVWRAAWRAYVVPLLIGLGMAMLGHLATHSDLAAGLGLLTGLVSGFVWMRHSSLDSGRETPIFSLHTKNRFNT